MLDAGKDAADCGQLPIFVTGSDAQEAANHDLAVLNQQQGLLVLNYEDPTAKLNRGWYASLEPCPQSTVLLHCDEYPFFSTEQGGPLAKLDPRYSRPDLAVIDADHNTKQGSMLRWFYPNCNMQTGTPKPGLNAQGGDAFIALPLPAELPVSIPTINNLCNGKPGSTQ